MIMSLVGTSIASHALKSEPEFSSILQEAENLVGGSRNQVYGEPLDDFNAIAGMMQAYWDKKVNKKFDHHVVAHFMMLVKIARLANSQYHRDSLVDIAGYARCAERCQVEEANRADAANQVAAKNSM